MTADANSGLVNVPTSVLASDGPATEAAILRALDAVSAPTYIHCGGNILYANAAMLRLLGYQAEELQAMPHYAWAQPGDQAALRLYGEQCAGGVDEPPVLELEALTRSGSSRHLEATARATQMGGRRVVLTTCQDLSDMRHVQTSLLEVGRVMHQIIENNPVPTFVIDSQHRVTHWNAACAQLTGIEGYDIQGQADAWRAFYPTERPLLADLIVDGTVEQRVQTLYDSKCRASATVANAYEAEDFFPNFGASGRWLYFMAGPLLDIQGKVIGAIETLQDVTERRLAQEQLQQHRRELEGLVVERTAELISTHHELEAFLENASVAILTTVNQKVTRHNKKFAQTFELGERSAIGLASRAMFCSDEDYAELGRIAHPVLSKGESLLHEMEMCTLQGNRIWVQLIAYVSDPLNPEAGAWWLIQDRTEVRRVEDELHSNYERIKQTNARLEEAQNQLLQSEKLASIGQLAAGVAHEINNPVGFVSSNLSSLRRYVDSLFQLLGAFESGASLESAEGRAEVARIKKAIDIEFIKEDLPQLLQESEEGLSRVKKIVQDLKDFSRVDQSDWQEADLNAGLDSTLNVVMNEVKYKAEVRKEYAQLPAVRCLAAQLNQVFMNLIVNAAHAIEQRGLITLSTGVVDDFVWIEVGDTGTGMTAEVQRRIFEPFFTTKQVGQGTGLGLSLSFSIVQKHGGRIEVDSVVGLGTRFRVWIPIAGPAASA
jgi:two-component system NtrC family sensor kinase